MLRELSIKNFAIIDDLHIIFSDGLTILSGETGAGKSIIINAVNLLLGRRAVPSLIRTGSDTLELEALFQIDQNSHAGRALADLGFDTDETLLIRRIISRNNKHRVYINGHTATIRMLHSVTANIAGISGQRAHQRLLKEEEHLLILDQFRGLMGLRDDLSRRFKKILPLIKSLHELKASQARQSEQIELLEFQKKEILEASIKIDEDTDLEQERMRFKNREELLRSVHHGLEVLYTGEGAVVERLMEVEKDLSKRGSIDKNLFQQTKRIAGAALQIEDIAEELRSYLKNLHADDKRLEEVEERIDLLHKLKRKYGGTLKHVFFFLNKIDKNLNKAENISVKIVQTEQEIAELHGLLAELAAELSAKRRIAAEELAGEAEKELSTLKMHNTRFKILLDAITADEDTDPFLSISGKAINETGVDRAVFLIAPNVGETLKPLSEIASGGELSRVVLALKAIMAKSESVETIVFDEVDAGIGGGVAEVAGKKLSLLARHHQVICITHLPQIAKFGDHHFRISKQVKNDRTSTLIEPVQGKDRVNEIARMLGGEKITAATLDHAREMLKQV
ncbi:MAG: DNA repair protein RecN [Deltaproteobacteria bacterium]|nr:DNA repair protein RecN [Deltaproteobacteria bacterium]